MSECLSIPLLLALLLVVPSDTAAQGVGSVIVVREEANILRGPSLTSVVLAVAPRGAVLPVRRREGDWYLVEAPRSPDGVGGSGYIHTQDVEFSEGSAPYAPALAEATPDVPPAQRSPSSQSGGWGLSADAEAGMASGRLLHPVVGGVVHVRRGPWGISGRGTIGSGGGYGSTLVAAAISRELLRRGGFWAAPFLGYGHYRERNPVLTRSAGGVVIGGSVGLRVGRVDVLATISDLTGSASRLGTDERGQFHAVRYTLGMRLGR